MSRFKSTTMIDAKLREGFWRLADPKISITSAASMAVGAAPAAGDAGFSWLWLLVLGLALFCMEVAKNAWGDVYDYDSGTTWRSGRRIAPTSPAASGCWWMAS